MIVYFLQSSIFLSNIVETNQGHHGGILCDQPDNYMQNLLQVNRFPGLASTGTSSTLYKLTAGRGISTA